MNTDSLEHTNKITRVTATAAPWQHALSRKAGTLRHHMSGTVKVLCWLVVLATPPALADSLIETPSPQRAIVVLGDSISAAYGIQREEGWVHLFHERLAVAESGWEVINASISGETTGGGLARLPGVLDELKPDIVIIELGGNDGLRGYPVPKIRANLNKMVQLVRAAGARPVIAAMRIPPNYGPRYTRAFDAVFAEVAEYHDATLVPFLLQEVALEAGMMQRDGIHPTAQAQPLLVNAVHEAIAPLL